MNYKAKFFRPVYERGTAPPDAMKMLVKYRDMTFQETDELIPAELINPSGDLSNQEDGIVFERQGEYWIFGPPGKRHYYKHNKGWEFLHYLMERPDQAVENVALYGGGLLQTGIQTLPDKDQKRKDIRIDKALRLRKKNSKQDFQNVDAVDDEQSLLNCKKRLMEIMKEKAELERRGITASNPEWARLDEEVHWIEAEIKRVVNPRGRNQENDRSRRNVSKHLHQVFKTISKDFPDLGTYLRNTITPAQGHQWIYRPGKDSPSWRLS